MEDCDHVRYCFEDDGDSLVNALDGDGKEAYEFKMMFVYLAAAMHRAYLLSSSFLRFLQFACMDSFLPAFEEIWMRYSWSGGMWQGKEKRREGNMYKIEYRNPDGTGFDETEPWVSEPVSEEQMEMVLEKMKSKGCTVTNIIDMGENVFFTQAEIQMLYAACMYYGDKLTKILKNLSNEEEISSGLSARAAEFWQLVEKITGYMGENLQAKE